MYHLMSFDRHVPVNGGHSQDNDHFHLPRGFLVRLVNTPPGPISHPQASSRLLSVTRDLFPFSGILYKWNHVACTTFWPGFIRSE